MLCNEFEDFQVFTGQDGLLTYTLAAGGAGAITALANVSPKLLRDVFEAHRDGLPTEQAQERLTAMREQMYGLGLPVAAVTKAILRLNGLLPNDYVRPPLRRIGADDEAELKKRLGL